MRRTIIILIIVMLLVAAGYFGYRQFAGQQQTAEEANPITTANTTPVNTGTDVVSAEGQVMPLRDVALAFQMGGTVAEILVAEGDTVNAGDPLLRLEAKALEIGRSQAEAGVRVAEAALEAARMQLTSAEARVQTVEVGVRSAEAQLLLVQSGARPGEIAAVENNVAAAQAGINQAAAGRDASLQIRDSQIEAAQANVAAQMGRVRGLQDQYDAILDDCDTIQTPDGEEKRVCWQYGPVEEAKRAELQQAKLQLEAAQAAVDALIAGPTAAQQAAASGSVVIATANRRLAEAQLALLQAGPTAEQIQQAEVGVEQAQTAVDQARAGVIQAQAVVSQAEAGVINAQAALDSVLSALEKTALSAAFAGTVGSINVELGEVVAPGVPVVTLADLSIWTVRTTDLTELDVVSVALGQPVEIRFDAIPDEVVEGTVTDIAAVSTLSRGDITYDVTIAVGSTPLPLRWGMTAFVDIDVK